MKIVLCCSPKALLKEIEDPNQTLLQIYYITKSNHRDPAFKIKYANANDFSITSLYWHSNALT